MGMDHNRPLNIVFFGTPDFAVFCLEALLHRKDQIVGVVTSPDRPAGRGKKLRSSAVKQFAQTKKLPLFQPNNLKDSDFVDHLNTLEIDLAVVVAFRMLPKAVWSIPTLGTFNLHASLLPQYRGAAPINWALVNGEKETGVTTFFIDEAIDTGAILLQRKIRINPGETAGSLHDRLAKLGSELIGDTIDGLQQKQIVAQPQNTLIPLQKAPKLTKENTRINWALSLEKLEYFVNGMNPYPGAWTVLEQDQQQMPLKLFIIRVVYESHSCTIGSLEVRNKQIRIAHQQGWVVCDSLQLPNKKRLSAADLLNGFQFEASARVI